MTKNRHRRVVALATAVACLVLLASPASAATHDAVITGGTLVVTAQNGTTETYTLGGTQGTGCGGTLAVDDGTGTTADITGYSDIRRLTVPTSSNHFVNVGTRLASTPGTITGTTVTSATVTFRTDIFLAANNTSTATDCATTGTRVCRLTTTLHFTGNLSSTPIGASTTIHLSTPNGTIAVTPPCAAIFAIFNAGTASISSLTAHATT